MTLSSGDSQCVTLRLTEDGSRLQVLQLASAGSEPGAAEQEDKTLVVLTSVALIEIQRIVVSSTREFGFSLCLRGGSCFNEEDDHSNSSSTSTSNSTAFVAPSAAELNQWVLMLTCGANAFQQQQQQLPPECGDPLLWQAARLRIFELAELLPLRDAVESVADGVQRLPRSTKSTSQDDSSRPQLFLVCSAD